AIGVYAVLHANAQRVGRQIPEDQGGDEALGGASALPQRLLCDSGRAPGSQAAPGSAGGGAVERVRRDADQSEARGGADYPGGQVLDPVRACGGLVRLTLYGHCRDARHRYDPDDGAERPGRFAGEGRDEDADVPAERRPVQRSDGQGNAVDGIHATGPRGGAIPRGAAGRGGRAHGQPGDSAGENENGGGASGVCPTCCSKARSGVRASARCGKDCWVGFGWRGKLTGERPRGFRHGGPRVYLSATAGSAASTASISEASPAVRGRNGD